MPSTPASDQLPGPPVAFERVPDNAILHGQAVGRPRLVVLPNHTFLMLKTQDIAAGGELLGSDDGRTWHRVDARANGLDAARVEDLAANETVAVILGTTGPLPGTGTEAPVEAEWTSADGVTWRRAPDRGVLQAFGAGEIVGSARGFATVGDAPLAVLVSGPDGRGWQHTVVPVALGARASVGVVAPAADGFLALGTVDGRSAAWRGDGAGWSRLPLRESDSILDIVGNDGRIIVTGARETPDPVRPDQVTVAAFTWSSSDRGATWGDTGLLLDGINDVRVLAVDGGFLAVLSPADPRAPLSAWRSIRPEAWEQVTLGEAGSGFDRPLVGAVAVSGGRVVLAGNTVGTGAGGDRVVVWIGDAIAP